MITLLFLQNAVLDAFNTYYGKPYPNQSARLAPRAASNREHHGILHALGCVDLVPHIHNLYKKHVNDYETTITTIAERFNVTPEELLILVQTAALFHDSGREGDGVDLWDKQSSDNLYAFLRTKNIPENLALFLRGTIVYKDHHEDFITTSSKIAELSGVLSTKLDYIRQLVNMSDTLEVIRVREQFDCKYLPITAISGDKLSATHQLPNDLDDLIISVAKRVNEEDRAVYQQQTVRRVDGTTFPIQLIRSMPAASHDTIFEAYCSAFVQERPSHVVNTRITMPIIYTKDRIDVQKFEQLCAASEPKHVVFIFPGNSSHHGKEITLFSIKGGGGLAAPAKKIGEKGYPTLSLPTTTMGQWSSDVKQQTIVAGALADLYRATGAGFTLMLPIRDHANTDYFDCGLDALKEKDEPSFWGENQKIPNKPLAQHYITELNHLAAFIMLKKDERQTLASTDKDNVFYAAYLDGLQMGANHPWLKPFFLKSIAPQSVTPNIDPMRVKTDHSLMSKGAFLGAGLGVGFMLMGLIPPLGLGMLATTIIVTTCSAVVGFSLAGLYRSVCLKTPEEPATTGLPDNNMESSYAGPLVKLQEKSLKTRQQEVELAPTHDVNIHRIATKDVTPIDPLQTSAVTAHSPRTRSC